MSEQIFEKEETMEPMPNCFILEGGDETCLEIAFVAGKAEETIPILEKHGIHHMSAIESLHHPEHPGTNIVLCKIRKEDAENWRAALDEIWENPPTEDYRDICGQLDQIFAEEARKKHE